MVFFNKKAFTFVELIVSIVIIAILTTIGFTSYIEYIADSRDSQRKSDLAQISSSLKVYKQKRGYYGNPGNSFNIIYSGATNVLVLQGKLNTNVHIDSLEKLPLDPANDIAYSYSITKNKQEFELVATLENGDFPKAILTGDYKSVSKNVLPTIILALEAQEGEDIEVQSGSIDGDENRKKFIFDNSFNNLVYTFEAPYSPYNDGTDFNTLLQEAEESNNFWQNSDYRNCVEINEAGKVLIPLTDEPFEYQIIDDDGNLTNTGCTTSNSF